MKRVLSHLLFYLMLLTLLSKPHLRAESILDDYIATGLENNLTLKQKNISYQKAIYSLDLAKSYFYPSIDFSGSLMSGEGGRRLDFPVGDMLNPIYSALNQFTNSNTFPTINNISQDFMPNEYYDVKIRTSVPILNMDINYNKDIQIQQANIKTIEIDNYKKELIKSIKVAYYNYISSVSQQKIYENALNLAVEGKRVNESLLKNGVNLPAYVLRSESEIQSINAKIEQSKNQVKMAQRYFNFLLNKDLESDITVDDSLNNDEEIFSTSFSAKAPDNRDELKMLEGAIDLNKSIVSMKKNYWIPTINGFADLGVQDDKFKFSSKSQYYLIGLQFNMPIFDFFKSSNKIDQAEMDLESVKIDYNSTKSKLELSIKTAIDDLESAKQNYITTGKQLQAAQSYYNLIEKGYKEGKNTFIEMIDARNQYTTSEILQNINKYRVLTSIAECEREITN